MALDSETLEGLLNTEEGPTLDFKREQYHFDKARNEDKSELLKDILAFANSQRYRTAYVLVGVEEVKGGRSEVLGVVDHLDDASLHQFVNSKTNRPVEFSYRPFSVENKEIGVLSIPIQTRPIYLLKNYERVGANTVYMRDGSSTRPASPDEIAAMGHGNPPRLRADWGDAIGRTVYPSDYVHRNTGLKLPDQFQTWEGSQGHYDFEALARKLGVDPAVTVSILNLAGNQLSGEIPSGLANSNMLELNLSGNQLSGTIPPDLAINWGDYHRVESINLSGNQLSGEIPPELGNYETLTELHLNNNALSGEIPSELGNLDNLKSLTLHENQLSGEIPSEVWNMLEREVEIEIHGNDFPCLTGGGRHLYIRQRANC